MRLARAFLPLTGALLAWQVVAQETCTGAGPSCEPDFASLLALKARKVRAVVPPSDGRDGMLGTDPGTHHGPPPAACEQACGACFEAGPFCWDAGIDFSGFNDTTKACVFDACVQSADNECDAAQAMTCQLCMLTACSEPGDGCPTAPRPPHDWSGSCASKKHQVPSACQTACAGCEDSCFDPCLDAGMSDIKNCECRRCLEATPACNYSTCSDCVVSKCLGEESPDEDCPEPRAEECFMATTTMPANASTTRAGGSCDEPQTPSPYAGPKDGQETITCPVAAAMYNHGDLDVAPGDGAILTLENMGRGLRRLGLDEASVALISNAFDGVDVFNMSGNHQKTSTGRDTEHRWSTGIRDHVPEGGAVPSEEQLEKLLKYVGPRGRLTVEGLIRASEGLSIVQSEADRNPSSHATFLWTATAMLQCLGTNAVLTAEDLRDLYIVGRYPQNFQPHFCSLYGPYGVEGALGDVVKFNENFSDETKRQLLGELFTG